VIEERPHCLAKLPLQIVDCASLPPNLDFGHRWNIPVLFEAAVSSSLHYSLELVQEVVLITILIRLRAQERLVHLGSFLLSEIHQGYGIDAVMLDFKLVIFVEADFETGYITPLFSPLSLIWSCTMPNS